MKLSMMLAVCGLAFGTGHLAMAQQEALREQPRESPRETSPRQGDRQGMQPGAQATGQAPEMMRQLEGVWKVKARVNRSHPEWKMKMGSGERPGGARGDHGGQADAYGDNGGSESLTLNGIAESRLILGGSVLQETLFMSAGSQAPQGMSGGMEGLSYIGFSPDEGTYSMVFMSGEEGNIRYESGSFREVGDKIVFNSDSASGGAGAEPRVVLEMVDDQTHRVTMYAASKTGEARDARDGAMRSDVPESGPLPENVVYQATYERMERREAAEYLRSLEQPAGGGGNERPDRRP